MKLIFLAAGKGKRIYKKIKKNKCLIEINGKTLIEILVNEVKKTKIKHIAIVTGFKANKIRKSLYKHKKIKFIHNKNYDKKEMLYSLIVGLKKFDTNLIFAYTDILFTSKIINKIIEKNSKNLTLPIFSNWKNVWKIRNKDPYKDAESLYINKSMKLSSIGEKIKKVNEVKYQFMGIIYIPRSQRNKILNYYEKIKHIKKLHVTNFLNLLLKNKFTIDCIKTDEKWYEFDDYSDYLNYKKYFSVHKSSQLNY